MTSVISRTEAAWVQKYRKRNAFWEHDGDASRPHVVLSSGEHSNGFFNSERVLEDPLLAQEVAKDLLRKLRKAGFPLEVPHRVVGPAMGAVTLVDILALTISQLRKRRPCLRAFAEKEEGGFVFKRADIQPGERILVCEDVSTRLLSIKKVADAVERAGAHVLPYYVMIINRSGKDRQDDRHVIALVNRNLPQWPADKCPLCKVGSEPLRPKDKENWARLNATD